MRLLLAYAECVPDEAPASLASTAAVSAVRPARDHREPWQSAFWYLLADQW